jgi:hypothetical protein
VAVTASASGSLGWIANAFILQPTSQAPDTSTADSCPAEMVGLGDPHASTGTATPTVPQHREGKRGAFPPAPLLPPFTKPCGRSVMRRSIHQSS